MYLANFQNGSTPHYQIRKSYRTGEGLYLYKIIFDLGDNPKDYIELFEEYIVFFNSHLVDAVSSQSKEDAESVLERLLWDFLPRETREQIARFQKHSTLQATPLSDQEKQDIASQVHLFDRRRLYYLRYGAVDQSSLFRLHEKCCRPLIDQSRDEREYYFAAEENVLSPGDYQQYIYAIFNIQKHFSQSFAPWLPEALAHDEVADHFLVELCRLNRDKRFWQSDSYKSSLHRHLTRYLIMFFDFIPAKRSFFENFAKTFMDDHRKFRWPDKKTSQTPEKISKIFATPYAKLKQMNGDQLNKLYRQKAMQLHPDKGGDHDLFIELTEVYTDLLRSKQ